MKSLVVKGTDLWYIPCSRTDCQGHAFPLPGTIPKHGPHDDECDEECDEPCWVPSDDQCGDHLMEDGWEEGFTCTRLRGHPGIHQMYRSINGHPVGTHTDGRPYHWGYSWAYGDQADEEQWWEVAR